MSSALSCSREGSVLANGKQGLKQVRSDGPIRLQDMSCHTLTESLSPHMFMTLEYLFMASPTNYYNYKRHLTKAKFEFAVCIYCKYAEMRATDTYRALDWNIMSGDLAQIWNLHFH